MGNYLISNFPCLKSSLVFEKTRIVLLLYVCNLDKYTTYMQKHVGGTLLLCHELCMLHGLTHPMGCYRDAGCIGATIRPPNLCWLDLATARGDATMAALAWMMTARILASRLWRSGCEVGGKLLPVPRLLLLVLRCLQMMHFGLRSSKRS